MRRRRGQRGAALLVVMVVVMVVTILALGFLERSDMELACGNNVALKTQIEYVALGGLTWGRAAVLGTEVSPGSGILYFFEYPDATFSTTRQSFEMGADEYYDLTINDAVPLADPNTFSREIVCTAYKEASDSSRVAETRVRGLLRYNTDTGEGFYVSIKRQN